MNKKYDQTDQERDQARRLEQGEAERQEARQDGVQERGQQQSGDQPRRQHGGRATDQEGHDSPRGSESDGGSGEKIVDEP
jgi:hypothetical protein